MEATFAKPLENEQTSIFSPSNCERLASFYFATHLMEFFYIVTSFELLWRQRCVYLNMVRCDTTRRNCLAIGTVLLSSMWSVYSSKFRFSLKKMVPSRSNRAMKSAKFIFCNLETIEMLQFHNMKTVFYVCIYPYFRSSVIFQYSLQKYDFKGFYKNHVFTAYTYS